VPIYDLSLLAAAAAFSAEGLYLRYGGHLGGKLVFAQVLLAWLYFGPHLSQAAAQRGAMQSFSVGLAVIGAWLAAELWRRPPQAGWR
jgi:hypothetical protein